MRAPTAAIALCFCLAACSDHVEVDRGDGGGPSDGADDCAKYCRAFTSLGCVGSTPTFDKCVEGCADSLKSCNPETRAFLTCALQPGLITCDLSSKLLVACRPQVEALSGCSSGSSGSGSSGSAPSR